MQQQAQIVSHCEASSANVSDYKLSPFYTYSGEVQRRSDTNSFEPHGFGVLQYAAALLATSAVGSAPREAGLVGPSSPSRASTSCDVTYAGGFLSGKRNGRGTVEIAKTRVKLTCDWKDDYPAVDGGICTLMTEDGDEYVGMVSMITDGSLTSKQAFEGLAWLTTVRFVPDATGEMFFQADRKRYSGEWQCGQRHGFGIETDSLCSYYFIGGFQYDSREGPGIVYQTNQRTILSGVWKDGRVEGAAGVHLPNQSCIVQSSAWSSIDHYQYESATIVKARVVDGIWEPLFVNFDNTLALTVAESIASSSTIAGNNSSFLPSATSTVVSRLEDIMKRDDFRSLLATFQRCFYFMYGSCQRLQTSLPTSSPSSFSTNNKNNSRAWSPSSGTPCPFPESYCCLSGLSGAECIHVYAREKKYTMSMLQQAVIDAASFVFSVRLRMLSYLAAIPAACDATVGRRILSMCWDVTFLAVEPLLMYMGDFLMKTNIAEIRLAAQRCEALTIIDFIGPLHLWFAAEQTAAAAATEGNERISSPREDSFMNEIEKAKVSLLSCNFTPLSHGKTTRSRQCRRSATTPSDDYYSVFSTSRGNVTMLSAETRMTPSKVLEAVQNVCTCVREASRIIALSEGPSTSSSTNFQYLQEQLLQYLLLMHSGGNRSIESVLSVLCVMLSDVVEPALPGVASSPSTSVLDSSANASFMQNDSMEGHRMLLAMDATDGERHIAMKTRFQISQCIMALRRSSTIWPNLRISRWGCVVPLEDWLLRTHHLLTVRFAKPCLDDGVKDDDDEDDDGNATTSGTAAYSLPQKIIAMKSCRELAEEIRLFQPSPISDLPRGALDILMWSLETIPTLIRKVLLPSSSSSPSLQRSSFCGGGVNNNSSVSSSHAATALKATSSFAFSSASTAPVATARRPIKHNEIESPAQWYRDIIPRLCDIAQFLTVASLKLHVEFLGPSGMIVAAPEEAAQFVLRISQLQQRANDQRSAQQSSKYIATGWSSPIFVDRWVDQWERTVAGMMSACGIQLGTQKSSLK